MILRDQAQFFLARQLRGKSGAPIADVFTFLSGLYFRGNQQESKYDFRRIRPEPALCVSYSSLMY